MLSFLITLQSLLNNRLHEEEGQGMVEYALIVGGISLVLVLAFVTLDVQTAVSDLSTSVANTISP